MRPGTREPDRAANRETLLLQEEQKRVACTRQKGGFRFALFTGYVIHFLLPAQRHELEAGADMSSTGSLPFA